MTVVVVVVVPNMVMIFFCLILFCFGYGSCQSQQLSNNHPSFFSCEGRASGYYADITSGCQVYHMCDGLGRKFSHRCPNKTLFQQRMLICDHWYMVDCDRSEEDYSANLLIGQADRRFVEEGDARQRTPLPDFASRGYKETFQMTETATPLPAHWSTELPKSEVKTRQIYYKTNYKTAVNFPSNYHATTPVYPATVKIDVSKLSEFDTFNFPSKFDSSLEEVKFPSNFSATTPVYPDRVVGVDLSKFDGSEEIVPPSVNFPSNFSATTPVYPDRVVGVDLSKFDGSEEIVPPSVNFLSTFKATTPVYPETVDATSQDPTQIGLVPPQQQIMSNKALPTFDATFRSHGDPQVSGSFTINQLTDFMTQLQPDQLRQLRRLWHVPDYEFPLDGAASRPTYR